MKQVIRYNLLLLALFFFCFCRGQVTYPVKKWTLTDCLTYAAEHNIEILTLQLNAQSSFQDLSAARAEKIPNLAGSVGNTFNNANNNIDGNGGLLNQLTSTGNYTLTSSIVLWNDNYVNNTIRQRGFILQSARLAVRQSMNNITLSIAQDYLAILLAEENLKYITDLVNASSARVKQGQMFYDAGSIPKTDLLQLKAQLAGDRYLLVQTENAVRQNILLLKQTLQLPSDTIFDIAVPDSVIVAQELPPLKDVQQSAIHNFPEIKISALDVDIAAADMAKAKAGFKPVLSADAAIGTGYKDVFTNAISPKTSYFTQTANNFYQRVGWTLSIPIFSNRINKTNLEKTRIAYKEANLNLQNSRLVLSQAVEQAYLNATNAIQSYQAATQQLEAAEENYRIVNEEFRLGAINTYDLLQQRNQYVQAIQAFTQAKYSAVLQQKIYQFYMGNPVTL